MDNLVVSQIAALEGYRASMERKRRSMWRLAISTALLPCLLTVLYVYALAAPMYSSETRFAVRGGDTQMNAPVGNVLAAGNPSMAMGVFVDGYAVRDYLKSRDAMIALSEKVDFPVLIAKGRGDPLWALSSNPTPDDLYVFYKSIVQPRYNIVEQIVVLEVSAFTPEDAVAIAEALLGAADSFVDQLNRKGLEDSLRVAQKEAVIAERRAIEARATMARWRSENQNTDPMSEATMLNGLISQLEQQLVTAEADIDLIRFLGDANHPRRRATEAQIAAIKAKIENTRKRLVGSTSAQKTQIAEFEGVKATQEFAEQNLSQARQSLEQARTTMMRQQRYVSAIAKPKPQAFPSYPDKTFLIGASILFGLTITFFLSLLFAVRRSSG